MSRPTALITGGTSGIGKATAELLHEQGYRVMVTGQNPESIAKAKSELPEDVIVVQADSRSLEDADRVVDQAEASLGSLDLLFLNAGIARFMPVEAFDEQAYDDIFAVNTKGQFFTLQKALPLVVDGGAVVITTGIAVRRGSAGGSVTAASRGALLSMVPSLAVELAPRGIRVNAVSPGAIETPLWSKFGMSTDVLDTVTEATRAKIPFQRLGDASEVAEVVAFLASRASGYVTGQEIAVAGGLGVGV